VKSLLALLAICCFVPGLLVALNFGHVADRLAQAFDRSFPRWYTRLVAGGNPRIYRANGVAFVMVAAVFALGAITSR